MLDHADMAAIQAILAQDNRPWMSVSDLLQGGTSKPYLAEIQLTGRDKGALVERADALARDLVNLGFDPVVDEPQDVLLGKAEPPTDPGLGFITIEHILIVTIPLWLKIPVYFNQAVVAMKELPGNIKALADMLSGGGYSVDSHEILALQAIADFLNGTYGQGSWTYNPDLVDLKPIDDLTVVDVTELNSGTRHLLAVVGGVAHELDASWRAAPPCGDSQGEEEVPP